MTLGGWIVTFIWGCGHRWVALTPLQNSTPELKTNWIILKGGHEVGRVLEGVRGTWVGVNMIKTHCLHIWKFQRIHLKCCSFEKEMATTISKCDRTSKLKYKWSERLMHFARILWSELRCNPCYAWSMWSGLTKFAKSGWLRRSVAGMCASPGPWALSTLLFSTKIPPGV